MRSKHWCLPTRLHDIASKETIIWRFCLYCIHLIKSFRFPHDIGTWNSRKTNSDTESSHKHKAIWLFSKHFNQSFQFTFLLHTCQNKTDIQFNEMSLCTYQLAYLTQILWGLHKFPISLEDTSKTKTQSKKTKYHGWIYLY